jgi:hypothetical protein
MHVAGWFHHFWYLGSQGHHKHCIPWRWHPGSKWHHFCPW